MTKRLFTILLQLGFVLLWAATGKPSYKSLNFENPGTRRVLKTSKTSYYYYRSLPEKAMQLDTIGITKLELRSFSTKPLKQPQVIILNGKTRTPYSLTLKESTAKYQVYEPLTIPVPENTAKLQVLCYDRDTYFRAFNVIPPKPTKPVKLKNLVLKAHAGAMTVQHNGSSSDYYSLLPAQPMRFTLNNGRDAYIYVRPRLLDRSTPKLGVFVNGDLIETIEFTLKRTTQYHTQGINNLGISRKIELPKNNSTSEIELRALSEHLFLAKPVLIKKP